MHIKTISEVVGSDIIDPNNDVQIVQECPNATDGQERVIRTTIRAIIIETLPV